MKRVQKQDEEPTIIAWPSAPHIEAPEIYSSGAAADDWSEFKEDFDEGSWVGTGITCVLPGGGNFNRGRRK